MLRYPYLRLVLSTLTLVCLAFQPVLAERSKPLVGNGQRYRRPLVGRGLIYQPPKRIRTKLRSQSPKQSTPVDKRRPRPPRRNVQRQRSPYRKIAQRRRKRLWRRPQPSRKSYVRSRKIYKRRYRAAIPKKIHANRHRQPRKIRTTPAIPKKKESFVKPRPITKIFTKLIKPVEQSMVFPLLLPHPITRAFGWSVQSGSGDRSFHSGVDIDAPVDLPVVAAYSGKVLHAGPESGYGLSVVLIHRQGDFLTRYGNCSELFTQAGRRVNQGQIICEVGNPVGEDTSHLHFELLVLQGDGKYVAQDPVYRTNIARVRLTQRLHLTRARSKTR